MNLDDLKKPFRPHEIEWRCGPKNGDNTQGMALAYIDARDVQKRLDEVCGPANWQNRFSHAAQKTCCEIGINVHGTAQQRMYPDNDGSILVDTLWVWKSDGAGDTDMEGEKGAFSSAFKRAASAWGVGRYLYDMKTPWVPIRQQGKSYVITDEGLKTLNKVYRDVIWQGPLGVMALKDTLKAFIGHLNNAQNADDIDALIHANQAALDQCEYDEPNWYYGHGDVPSIDERITGKREEMTEAA